MFKPFLDDYYKSKIGVKEICEILEGSPSTFRRWLKRSELIPRQNYLKAIDTGINELNQVLKDRYSSIVNRCNGKTTDYYGRYKDKEYVAVYDWVDFCNNNKDILKEMWVVFIENGKSSRYAISIDRLFNTGGYTLDNMQFVTHGFNSWKRTLNPISVIFNNKKTYFLSCEEASNYHGLRLQTNKKHKGYDVISVEVKDVLSNRGIGSIGIYYQALLEDENKQWDTRKRGSR